MSAQNNTIATSHAAPPTTAGRIDSTSPTKRQLRRIHFTRRAGDGSKQTGASWLVSFADVMALMLTFFVLQFAMSNPEQESWDGFAEALNNNFNKYYGATDFSGAQDHASIGHVQVKQALKTDYLKNIIEKLMGQDENLSDITLRHGPDYIAISLPTGFISTDNGQDIDEHTKKTLFALSEVISRLKNRIEIVGYTTPHDQNGNSWEAALAHAAIISNYLHSTGYEKTITLNASAIHETGQTTTQAPHIDIIVMEDAGDQARKTLTIE